MDFACISSTHCGDVVRIHDSTFEQVHLVIKLQAIHGEERPRKQNLRNYHIGKNALIADVVDGQDRACAGEIHVVGIQAAQQDGNERCLPIVYVKDVRRSEALGRLDHGPGKHGKAFGVIGVIATAVAVESVAEGKLRVIDKVKLHSFVLTAIDNLTEELIVPHGNGEILDYNMFLFESGLLVTRQEYGNFVTQRRHSLRQRAHDVGEAAGLRVGHAFRRCEGDSHPELLGLGFTVLRPVAQSATKDAVRKGCGSHSVQVRTERQRQKFESNVRL